MRFLPINELIQVANELPSAYAYSHDRIQVPLPEPVKQLLYPDMQYITPTALRPRTVLTFHKVSIWREGYARPRFEWALDIDTLLTT